MLEAVKANAASAVRTDTNGNATFPAVPPGIYYLIISTRYKQSAARVGRDGATQNGPELRHSQPGKR